MTSKEKAEDIYNKFKIKVTVSYTENSVPCVLNALMLDKSAKQCALLCVNQILENDYGSRGNMIFWKEVKQEINKL